MFKLLFLLLTLLGTASAEEGAVLDAPYDPDTRTTSVLRVNRLTFNWSNSPANSSISIELSSGTITRVFRYEGQDARDQMVLLNKANLTSNSLHKRVLNKLISDGFISGTVVGSPD